MSCYDDPVVNDLCRQCLDAVGSLRLVFALWREARFVRLSVAHKWHLMNSAPTYNYMTMCNRSWGRVGVVPVKDDEK